MNRELLANIPAGNCPVDARQPHTELLDLEDGTIWQSLLPMGRDTYRALALPETLLKMGLGAGVMDAHYFRRSPGASEDGPVASREIAGATWIHCANTPSDALQVLAEPGPSLVMVEKHHSLIFDSGREVELARTPQGVDYVRVIAGNPGTEVPLQLPQGWELRRVTLAEPVVMHLPCPTEAWFIPGHGCFQGPVTGFPIN